MKKILTVLGARPQFIKAAALSHCFRLSGKINEIYIHTGQHYNDNLSEVFFNELGLKTPSYFLNSAHEKSDVMLASIVNKLISIIENEDPDWILVFGDTTSTLGGALAAASCNIPLVHVEAGLRSFDLNMPEERNRRITDHLSQFLFCPSQRAIQNLNREGINSNQALIMNCGDIMLDTIQLFSSRFSNNSLQNLQKLVGEIPDNFVLCTVHRAASTDQKETLSEIFRALDKINDTLPVILPLHPRTQKYLNTFQIQTKVRIIQPLSYLQMLQIMMLSSFIITDSGGLQKEAYYLKKSCLVLRNETEWTELVENGFSLLAGTDYHKIIECSAEIVKLKPDFNIKLYGNGMASQIITDSLLQNSDY